jgi:hypothetical protein
VIWCTGFTGDLSWLELPVVDTAVRRCTATGRRRYPGCISSGFRG